VHGGSLPIPSLPGIPNEESSTEDSSEEFHVPTNDLKNFLHQRYPRSSLSKSSNEVEAPLPSTHKAIQLPELPPSAQGHPIDITHIIDELIEKHTS
jgi:hypothetical protein